MSRLVTVAAAWMGPIQRADSLTHGLDRLIRLLEGAAGCGATLVVFAFTTFFPRWLLEGDALDRHCERSMPNPDVPPLFDPARKLGVGFNIGDAELTPEGERFNFVRHRRPAQGRADHRTGRRDRAGMILAGPWQDRSPTGDA